MLVCGAQMSQSVPLTVQCTSFSSISDGLKRAAEHKADCHSRYMIESLLIIKLVYMILGSALFVFVSTPRND